MIEKLLPYIEPTQPYLLLTFIVALVFLDYKKISNTFLLLILFICCFNEITTDILLMLSKNMLYFSTVNLMLHNLLWLWLLSKVCNNKIYSIATIGYVCYCVASFFIFEGLPLFDIAFVSGALLYVVLFIVESFRQLKKERFAFFTSNDYLVLFAPVLFFIGISFICGFSNRAIAKYVLFGETTLYQCIAYFVNIVYYTVINYYIYSENKIRYAK